MTDPAGQLEPDASGAPHIPEGALAGPCLACAVCGSPPNGSAELD